MICNITYIFDILDPRSGFAFEHRFIDKSIPCVRFGRYIGAFGLGDIGFVACRAWHLLLVLHNVVNVSHSVCDNWILGNLPLHFRKASVKSGHLELIVTRILVRAWGHLRLFADHVVHVWDLVFAPLLHAYVLFQHWVEAKEMGLLKHTCGFPFLAC